MIKAIIFDFGSVLFKTDWKEIDSDFIKKYRKSIRIGENQELVKIYLDAEVGKSTMKEFLGKIDPLLGNEKAINFYKESYLKHKILNKEMRGLFSTLKKKYLLYGFTDTNKEHFEANKEAGLFNDFKEVFTSFQFEMRKSEEGAFKKLLQNISLKPQECLFIDDHAKNIENARKQGFEVIHYTSFPQITALEGELMRKKINPSYIDTRYPDIGTEYTKEITATLIEITKGVLEWIKKVL